MLLSSSSLLCPVSIMFLGVDAVCARIGGAGGRTPETPPQLPDQEGGVLSVFCVCMAPDVDGALLGFQPRAVISSSLPIPYKR